MTECHLLILKKKLNFLLFKQPFLINFKVKRNIKCSLQKHLFLRITQTNICKMIFSTRSQQRRTTLQWGNSSKCLLKTKFTPYLLLLKMLLNYTRLLCYICKYYNFYNFLNKLIYMYVKILYLKISGFSDKFRQCSCKENNKEFQQHYSNS